MKRICYTCGVEYDQPHHKATRGKAARGLKSYCSTKCQGFGKTNPLTWLRRLLSAGLTNRRERGKDNNAITVNELYEVWAAQEGRCAATGVLLNPDAPNPLLRPSLDRKDSALGYVAGNVHIVTRAYNYMKNRYSESEAQEALSIMANGA